MRFAVLFLSVLLGAAAPACSKSSGSKDDGKGAPGGGAAGGAATAEAAARGFLDAAGRRDQAAALAFVMSEASCARAPEERRGECPAFVKQVRESIPAFIEKIPKGFVADQVQADGPPPGARGGEALAFLKVTPKGGGEAIPVFVMKLGDRHFVMLPVRRKSRKG